MEVEQVKERVLTTLKEYHDQTDGHCGLSPAKICLRLNIKFQPVREALNELYDDSLINVHKGVNSLLVFHKKTSR
jgi:transcription initiation factor IIE alpha subunit